jgi:hypothetical protein
MAGGFGERQPHAGGRPDGWDTPNAGGEHKPPSNDVDVFLVKVDNPTNAYFFKVEDRICDLGLLFESREVHPVPRWDSTCKHRAIQIHESG